LHPPLDGDCPQRSTNTSLWMQSRRHIRVPAFARFEVTLSVFEKHPGSPLDAHHLLQGMHDIDEIDLCGHHCIDVLVRAGDLVEHALILAALDTSGLVLEIFDRVRALRGAT
jgi:hypothetical protein